MSFATTVVAPAMSVLLDLLGQFLIRLVEEVQHFIGDIHVPGSSHESECQLPDLYGLGMPHSAMPLRLSSPVADHPNAASLAMVRLSDRIPLAAYSDYVVGRHLRTTAVRDRRVEPD